MPKAIAIWLQKHADLVAKLNGSEPEKIPMPSQSPTLDEYIYYFTQLRKILPPMDYPELHFSVILRPNQDIVRTRKVISSLRKVTENLEYTLTQNQKLETKVKELEAQRAMNSILELKLEAPSPDEHCRRMKDQIENLKSETEELRKEMMEADAVLGNINEQWQVEKEKMETKAEARGKEIENICAKIAKLKPRDLNNNYQRAPRQ